MSFGVMKVFVVLSVLAIGLVYCQTNPESSVHWQWRDLICTTKEGSGPDKISKEKASCTIALRETETDRTRRLGEKEAGCFDETVNGTARTYCDLHCPHADTVYLIKRDPQVHRSCFVFYTHRLERRGDDWFLWRDKNCRQSQITFTIRCEFLFNRREFPSDKEVFERAKKRIA
ncbi:unnamed protein product [Bursaphelenchus xylophilus]|uniref:(pine wood nematode) hypothetical protein n=1 Tax=Bursaphelenchus xylophilus TaxID=6326 RepID=A0A1I7SE16_BURXY|nr:unnamed protein product [Bursaphelenchus xylophilus]CAG9113173.1 unnamed protein product [Bursaphelenchus xylophilus]